VHANNVSGGVKQIEKKRYKGKHTLMICKDNQEALDIRKRVNND